MKSLYKSTKVVFNAHLKQYEVYYRNWFVWHLDSTHKYDEQGRSYPVHYRMKDVAEQAAIVRAQAMLDTKEVWRGSVFLGGR